MPGMKWLLRRYDEAVESASAMPWLLVALVLVFSLAVTLGYEYLLSRFTHYGASVGQVLVIMSILAVILLLGIRERHNYQARLLDPVDTINDLTRLTPRQFEAVAGQALRLAYPFPSVVHERGGFSPDGGMDLMIETPDGRLLVQCKRWRNLSVPVDEVRSLAGVVAINKAAGGILVATSQFTLEAKAEAARAKVRLIDGPQLVTLIRQGSLSIPAPGSAPVGPACPRCRHPMQVVLEKSPSGPLWKCTACWFTAHEGPASSQTTPHPSCPNCSSPMLPDRHLSGGALPFWGCPSYYSQNCQGRRLYYTSP